VKRVIDQFAELGREPLPLPSPPPPPFAAAALTVVEPELRDLFRDISWRGKRAAGFRDLRLDPWRLYRAGRHADFYDPGWSTARFGLDLWHKRHRKQAWVRQLSRDDRNAFEAWFETFFEAELARRFAGVADRAFDRGYDAGWRYGTRVGREWQYRRGYHAGFERGVQDSAREVFYSSFQPSWAAAYNALFREWSTTVKLETRASRLGDENDDGVFEPGEELFVELELANLGGGSGRFEAQLTGSVLTGSSQTTIDLPPRSVADQPTRLRGRISPLAVPMSDSLLTVTVGELAETLPVRVSHILLFEGGPELSAHDALLGTAVVEVTLSNTSRQAVRATLEATLPKGLIVNPRRELTRIPPGATRTLRFEIEELPALDLLAGNIVFTVASETGGRPQGRLEGRLPELATDLSDGSMVAYTLRLARSPATDKVEVRRAHELMLRRLEADWQRAVRADGNPYKRDLRGGTRSTALGELVASVQAESGRLVNHAVFTDLVPRIDRLSRSLPGSHPFLRRSMRKLGRKLL
jgi:hypothetical protein